LHCALHRLDTPLIPIFIRLVSSTVHVLVSPRRSIVFFRLHKNGIGSVWDIKIAGWEKNWLYLSSSFCDCVFFFGLVLNIDLFSIASLLAFFVFRMQLYISLVLGAGFDSSRMRLVRKDL